MLKTVLSLCFIAGSVSFSYAAECSSAIHRRWESAMAEAMQIDRVLVRSQTIEPDTATLCRIVKNATELLAAGKDYFSACDPLDSGRRQIILIKMEALLAKTDASPCLKPAQRGTGKKT